MANITITFEVDLPVGIQVNDVAWYVDSVSGAEIQIGVITSIIGLSITIDALVGVSPPTENDFVFYVKDTLAVVGALKGYYAEAQFVNNSTSYGELFSVGSEIFESSK